MDRLMLILTLIMTVLIIIYASIFYTIGNIFLTDSILLPLCIFLGITNIGVYIIYKIKKFNNRNKKME